MEEAHSIVQDLGDGVIDSLYQVMPKTAQGRYNSTI